MAARRWRVGHRANTTWTTRQTCRLQAGAEGEPPGGVLAPAKDLGQMREVVTNSTVDSVLSVLYAALIIIVIGAGAWTCIKALPAREPLPTTETPFVESKISAPAGLFPTADERRELAAAGAAHGGEGIEAGAD
jgi:carbon starvation protein